MKKPVSTAGKEARGGEQIPPCAGCNGSMLVLGSEMLKCAQAECVLLEHPVCLEREAGVCPGQG